MQVVHIIATTGSAIISGCMVSMGALTADVGDESLCRQAMTLLKLGGGAISGLGLGDPGGDADSDFSWVACLHSLALWYKALPPALQLHGQHPTFCWDLEGLPHRCHQPGGMQLLHPTREFALSTISFIFPLTLYWRGGVPHQFGVHGHWHGQFPSGLFGKGYLFGG